MNHSGSPVKQVTAPRFMVKFICLAGIAALAGIGYLLYDYGRLQQTVAGKQALEVEIDTHLSEIAHQRKQLQNFASEINQLKAKLLALNDFEEKIRIIANIDTAEVQDGLFGVGGSMPEDIDPGLDLSKNHTGLIKEMHGQVEQLNLAAVHQEQGLESLLKYLEDRRNLLAYTPAIRPTEGWTSSRFGYRHSPFTGRREFHKGVDIANRKGTPVVATADGNIRFTGKKGLLGKVVVIDHGHGLVTRYAHLGKILKKRGAAVKRGEKIAEMGNTGRSTGPHLHYEVHLNGLPVNPKKYIMN